MPVVFTMERPCHAQPNLGLTKTAWSCPERVEDARGRVGTGRVDYASGPARPPLLVRPRGAGTMYSPKNRRLRHEEAPVRLDRGFELAGGQYSGTLWTIRASRASVTNSLNFTVRTLGGPVRRAGSRVLQPG